MVKRELLTWIYKKLNKISDGSAKVQKEHRSRFKKDFKKRRLDSRIKKIKKELIYNDKNVWNVLKYRFHVRETIKNSTEIKI